MDKAPKDKQGSNDVKIKICLVEGHENQLKMVKVLGDITMESLMTFSDNGMVDESTITPSGAIIVDHWVRVVDVSGTYRLDKIEGMDNMNVAYPEWNGMLFEGSILKLKYSG